MCASTCVFVQLSHLYLFICNLVKECLLKDSLNISLTFLFAIAFHSFTKKLVLPVSKMKHTFPLRMLVKAQTWILQYFLFTIFYNSGTCLLLSNNCSKT